MSPFFVSLIFLKNTILIFRQAHHRDPPPSPFN